MSFHLTSFALQAAWRWTWTTSLSALVLIGLIVFIRFICGKILPLRCHYGLWLCVVARLILPMAPASDWSIFNLNSRVVLQNEKAPDADPATPMAVGNANFSAAPSTPGRAHAGSLEELHGVSILDVLPG